MPGSSAHPAINITGLSDVYIAGNPDIALENPGPPVNIATEGSPVIREYPSAMCIAAPSCRVSMNSIPSSAAASTKGKIVSPTIVNTFLIPSSFKLLTKRCDPVILAMIYSSVIVVSSFK